jgi:hypothetical protein
MTKMMSRKEILPVAENAVREAVRTAVRNALRDFAAEAGMKGMLAGIRRSQATSQDTSQGRLREAPPLVAAAGVLLAGERPEQVPVPFGGMSDEDAWERFDSIRFARYARRSL